MATTTFTSYVNKNVGTAAATVVTAAAGAQTNIIGMTCANTTNTAVTVSVYITRSAVDYFIISVRDKARIISLEYPDLKHSINLINAENQCYKWFDYRKHEEEMLKNEWRAFKRGVHLEEAHNNQ